MLPLGGSNMQPTFPQQFQGFNAQPPSTNVFGATVEALLSSLGDYEVVKQLVSITSGDLRHPTVGIWTPSSGTAFEYFRHSAREKPMLDAILREPRLTQHLMKWFTTKLPKFEVQTRTGKRVTQGGKSPYELVTANINMNLSQQKHRLLTTLLEYYGSQAPKDLSKASTEEKKRVDDTLLGLANEQMQKDMFRRTADGNPLGTKLILKLVAEYTGQQDKLEEGADGKLQVKANNTLVVTDNILGFLCFKAQHLASHGLSAKMMGKGAGKQTKVAGQKFSGVGDSHAEPIVQQTLAIAKEVKDYVASQPGSVEGVIGPFHVTFVGSKCGVS